MIVDEASQMTEVETLVETYKQKYSTMSEHDRARMERALWLAAPASTRSTSKRDVWLLDYLARDSSFTYKMRAEMLNAEPATNAIWERVEAGTLPFSAGYRVLRNAKTLSATEDIDLAEGVERALAEYDGLPSRRTLADGTVINTKIPNFRPIKASGKKPKRSRGRPNKQPAMDEFWDALRDQIVAHVSARASGVDPIKLTEITKEFSADVQTLIKEWQQRISRLAVRTAEAVEAAPERKNILSACRILGVDPPRPGKNIDDIFLAKAKQKKKLLVRQYHPDTQGEATRAAFEAVMEAFEVIKAAHTGGEQ